MGLRVTGSGFYFRLDGTKVRSHTRGPPVSRPPPFLPDTFTLFHSLFLFQSVLARAVSADPLTMSKLLASGIDFAAPPTPVNVLGLVVTFAYLAFLWRMSSRMLQVRLSPPLLLPRPLFRPHATTHRRAGRSLLLM